MTENTQEARLQLGANVGRRVNELIHNHMASAEFLRSTSRTTLENVKGKTFVALNRGGYTSEEVVSVHSVEIPRDTIRVTAYWDKDEIPDEDELVKLVEDRLVEWYVKRYEAVEFILGSEPKVVVFGGVRTKEFLDADGLLGSTGSINGYWHFIVDLDIGIAGVK